MGLADIGISKENDECLKSMRAKGYFDDDKTAAKYAVSFALNKFDFETYQPLDKYKGNFTNNKWHTSDFDNDYFFRNLITLYFNDVEDLDYALRSLISISLDKVYEIIKDNKDWTIIDIL